MRSKEPEGLVHNGTLYLNRKRLEKHIKEVGAYCVQDYKKTYARTIQEMLDNGVDVDIRDEKRIAKNTEKCLKTLYETICADIKLTGERHEKQANEDTTTK